MIDWADSVRIGHRQCFAVYCNRCRQPRYLPKYHAKLDTYCYHCSCADKARTYRLAHPSGPERNLMRQLTELNIPFVREVPLLWYNVDFVVKGLWAIEVDGGTIHTDLREPGREARRLAAIREEYELLIITDGNTKHCKTLLKEFLNV